MRRNIWRLSALAISALALAQGATAEPSFARKYHADCTLCHTIYPRLNRTGYEFRRLGYRLPAEVEARLNRGTSAAATTAAVPAPTPTPTTASAEEGRKLYEASGCSACHSIAGKGASVGPALDGIASRRSKEWMQHFIANPTAPMPPVDLSKPEIEKLVEYLRTLPASAGGGDENTRAIPRLRWSDYVGAAYLPAEEIDRSPGAHSSSFDRRDLNVYLAGTAGSHLSFFVQPLPATDQKGFVSHFEMIEGSYTVGDSTNFLHVRFGQMNDLLSTGFAGADRPVGDIAPLVYESANSFNPGEMMRGGSVEYTRGLTTVKAFGGYQMPPEDLMGDGMGGGAEAKWSRTYGFAVERIIGKKGLSGVQLQYAGGYTPVSIAEDTLPALRFKRLSLFANKTFEDKRGVERVNLIAGVALLSDSRILSLDDRRSSHGYGYFFETNLIPVHRLGLVFRFDQMRATTLVADNAESARTTVVTYDFVKYARMSFAYQHTTGDKEADVYRISWQLNF